MKAAVLFDMDGVIVNTEPLKFRAYHEVFLRTFGVDIEDSPKRLGLPEQAVMNLYLEAHDLKSDVGDLIRRKRQVYLDLLSNVAITPAAGLLSLMDTLRERLIPVGLATSSDRVSTERVLARLMLRRAFNAIFTRDDVEHPKPEPEIFLKLAGHLETDPGDCVVIEDSPAGISAGKRAGMTVVGIASDSLGSDLLAAGADFVIPDFAATSREHILRLCTRNGGQPAPVN